MEKTLILTAYAYWEIAFIYAFTVYFDRPDLATLFPTPVISPQILEDAVINDAHGLLGDLMRAFLSNAMNRKKPLLPENSDRLLFSYIGSKLQVDDFDLGYNPLANHGSFEGLTPELKLRILHALVEWQLQDSAAVRTIVETVYNTTKKSDPNPLAPLPIGYDGQKRAYWQFGDSPFLWRERTHLKQGCEWEIVCRNLDELRTFANDLLDHHRPLEKALATTLLHTLIPDLEEKQAIQERKDRKEAQKLAALLEVRTLPRRERRKPARYDYSEDFLFEDDLQGDKTWTNDDDKAAPPKRQPTRSSRRLNGDQSIQLDDDELLDVE